MAFFNSLKRAFGFSSEDEEYFDDSTEVTDEVINPFKSDLAEPSKSVEETAEPEDEKVELPMEIFDGVIAIFNQSLPDFVKQCVDVDAQRRYIYNSLDESLKTYLRNASDDARRRGASQWEGERQKLQKELGQLREQSKSLETSKTEWKQQQLSLDRQKRALSDRIRDLENQVASLEAEKEQYELETKSLVNKIKVAGVHENDMAAMREELDELRRRLAEAQETGGDALIAQIAELKEKNAEKETIIKSLNEQVEQLSSREEAVSTGETQLERLQQSLTATSEALQAKEEEIAGYAGKVTGLNAENARLSMLIEQMKSDAESSEASYQQQIEELKTKILVSDRMLSELHSSASSATDEMTKKDEEIASLLEEKKVATDSLEVLNEKFRLVNDELQTTRDELEQARGELQVVSEIQEQVERFEEVKNKKDARIASLQAESQKLKDKIDYLENEKISLKRTIENNLVRQASSESELRREIEKLKADLEEHRVATPPMDDLPAPEIVKKPRKKTKVNAIDTSIDDTEWLMGTPPPDAVTKPASTPDPDFGYQEPTRKSHPENDAQMSLW